MSCPRLHSWLALWSSDLNPGNLAGHLTTAPTALAARCLLLVVGTKAAPSRLRGPSGLELRGHFASELAGPFLAMVWACGGIKAERRSPKKADKSLCGNQGVKW